MKKKNNRILWSLILAMLVPTLLTGCKKQDLSAQKQNVYAQWEYCLRVQDWICDTVLWALDEAQPYSEEFTWDTLLKARAAVSAAKVFLENVELTGCEVSSEDYLDLLKAGLEPEVVLTEYENLETTLSQSLTTLTCLEEMLLTDICFSPNAQVLGDWLDNCRKMIEMECQYLCLTTNYLILQWGYSEKWSTFPETYPTIAKSIDAWYTDPDLLTKKGIETLDHISNLQTGEAEYYGISMYTSDLLQGITILNRPGMYQYQKLLPYLQTIPGADAFFPTPDWLPEELQIVYQIPDPATGEVRSIQYREAVEVRPSLCLFSCSGIEREQIKDYAALLQSLGLEVHTDFDEPDSCLLLCKTGEYTLSVQWKDGETDLYLPSPVGCLVPEWYLAALLSE